MAKLPATYAELLATADAKLQLAAEGGAKRVFMSTGDEISEEEFELIEHDDVLYFSTGDDWVAPPPSIEQSTPTPPAAATADAVEMSSRRLPPNPPPTPEVTDEVQAAIEAARQRKRASVTSHASV